MASLQAPPDTWQRTQNVSLAFNRAASLQLREVHVSTLKSASLQQNESRIDRVSSVFSGLHLGKTRELGHYSQRELRLYFEVSSHFVTLKAVFPHQAKGVSSL